MPEQGCTNCGGKGCGKCCGGWGHKKWKRHGGGSAGCGGGIWAVGWLFTIGFLKLAFWKGVLAIVLWPYFLGSFFAR